ncbi:MAG: hypothetical protein BWK79_14260 [Beggiatoa sp. IS2]|nr:MAG: hypothetical protein BWK79_14260 [Beggiatoa sp. IS2]
MANSPLRRLQEIFEQLPSAEQATLLAFAEFLYERAEILSKPLPEPQLIPRPANESVVAAIKRLAKSYPMLEKKKVLDETSNLMTQHILQGRNPVEVIDELEIVFLRHYEILKKQQA